MKKTIYYSGLLACHMVEEGSSVEVLFLPDSLLTYLQGIFLDANWCKRAQHTLGSTIPKAGEPELYNKAWSQASMQHSSISFCFKPSLCGPVLASLNDGL